MSFAAQRALQSRIALLKQDHRDLDDAIAALSGSAVPDQIQLARFKKRKLLIKDEIIAMENSMIPDIIA